MEEESTIPKNAIEELTAIYMSKKKNGVAPVTSQTVVSSPTISAIEKPVIPLEKTTVLPEPTPQTMSPQNQAVSDVPMSFDSMFTKIRERQLKKIDDEAAAKKRDVENRLFDKFENFIESIASDVPVPTQPVSQPQTPKLVVPELKLPPPSELSRVQKPNPKPEPKQSNKKLYVILALGFIAAFLVAIGIGLGKL